MAKDFYIFTQDLSILENCWNIICMEREHRSISKCAPYAQEILKKELSTATSQLQETAKNIKG